MHKYFEISGLLVDHVNKQLYFTNMDFAVINGVAFSWHKIEMISLEGENRMTVNSGVEQPRGLYIDYEHRYRSNYDYHTLFIIIINGISILFDYLENMK